MNNCHNFEAVKTKAILKDWAIFDLKFGFHVKFPP